MRPVSGGLEQRTGGEVKAVKQPEVQSDPGIAVRTERFIRAIERDEPPDITCEDAMIALNVSHAALQSIESGEKPWRPETSTSRPSQPGEPPPATSCEADRLESDPDWLKTLNREQRIIMRSYTHGYARSKPPKEGDLRIRGRAVHSRDANVMSILSDHRRPHRPKFDPPLFLASASRSGTETHPALHRFDAFPESPAATPAKRPNKSPTLPLLAIMPLICPILQIQTT